VAGVQIGDDDFLAIVILEDDRDRTLDDVIQGVAFIAFVDDCRPVWISLAMTMDRKLSRS
jgi:hypothetical protein